MSSSRLEVTFIKVDPFRQHVTAITLRGRHFARDIMRHTRAKQLGHRELCMIEEQRLMGHRPDGRGGIESFDAGPTSLIASADVMAEDGIPGWRLIGGQSTAGIAMLFGKGIGGSAVDCPVSVEWVNRHIVWLTPEETDAEDDFGEIPVTLDDDGEKADGYV